MSFIDHISNHWEHYLSATGASFFSVINGQAYLQSMAVGVSLFVITTIIKTIFAKIWTK